MNIQKFRDYCLSFRKVNEEFPFDNNTLVFKVKGKIFALCNVDQFDSLNVKCEPAKAIELREKYPDIVIPGYHMNKKHWNTVKMPNNLPDDLLKSWIMNSYDLVVAKLPMKDQETLK
ncbi:MAG: MmcQ/YjbR family DNA-binding protein [Balneolaceae bacterium]|nr:MmcQ/YjbR family DNA-binding protein [Balneolaceae bacterium]